MPRCQHTHKINQYIDISVAKKCIGTPLKYVPMIFLILSNSKIIEKLLCNYFKMQAPVMILNQNTKRETGKTAQLGNISAAKAVSDIIRTTLGPRSMLKMLLDHRLLVESYKLNLDIL